ncbi:MAG TPA: rRNA pseudouridine synthase [Phycisphaerales bacterium]|nr:rRNA pseudouridine synthase [Phycisphaerales bacterium]
MPRLDPDDIPARYDDKSRGPRLQRTLAEAGVAARRVCEQLILDGEVEVNGTIVDTLPAFVDPERDRITVQGRPIKRRSRKLYIMLNKPTHTVTTTADEPDLDRRTVLDLVDHPTADRLFPVGRLDFDTTGLILLTNDGELANKLTHPRFGVVKTYHAVVKGRLSDEDAAELARGIYLAERKAGRTEGASRTARVEVRVHKRDRDRTVLELKLREGRNRQVRRMLAAVGCPVKKLERVAMGPVKLKGLPRGAWRELSRGEIDALRRAITRGKGDAEKAEPKRAPVRDQGEVRSRVDKRRMKNAVARAGKPERTRRPRRDDGGSRR